MSIDVHSHLVAPTWFDEIMAKPALYGLSVTQDESGHRIERNDTGRPYRVSRSLADSGSRVSRLDEMGLVAQVVAPVTPTLFYDLDRRHARNVARLHNETLSDLTRTVAGGRLIPAATVPMNSADDAIAELDHAVNHLGARMLFIASTVGGQDLDAPQFRPVFSRATELGVPVQIHPSSPDVEPRLQKQSLQILLGNPMDTAVAAASLVSGGVLDALSELQVILVHGGGAFPYLSGRMEHGYRAIRDAQSSVQGPRSYLRRFHYDTVVHDPRALRFLAETVGFDRLVIGTDSPYVMADANPVASVEAAGLGVGIETLGATAAGLLGVALTVDEPSERGMR